MADGKKLCSCCRQWLGTENFYRDASRRDGLQYRCKTCQGRRRPEEVVKYRAIERGMNPFTVYSRLKRGWTLHEALYREVGS